MKQNKMVQSDIPLTKTRTNCGGTSSCSSDVITKTKQLSSPVGKYQIYTILPGFPMGRATGKQMISAEGIHLRPSSFLITLFDCQRELVYKLVNIKYEKK